MDGLPQASDSGDTPNIITDDYPRNTAQMQNNNGWVYRGHKAWIQMPASLTLDANTIHNLYTQAMVQPSGAYVESGMGWSRAYGYPNPIIFTYDTIVATWRYVNIPSGYSRAIYVTIDIIPDPPYGGLAEMYVQDPYSGLTVDDYRAVPTMGNRAVHQQEQASFTWNGWTVTPTVHQWDHYLKNSNNAWINWNTSIPTGFIPGSTMHENHHGITNNRYWFDTWCTGP